MNEKKNKKVKGWLAPILYFGLKNKAYDFIENLSYFLYAGLPISGALESLEEETHSWRMRRIIRRVRDDIQSGMNLSDSFDRQTFFEESIIEIVKAGELSGNLVNNLKLAVLLNDKDKKLKSKLNSSLLYGTIIIILTIVVGTGTAWFTLPQIAKVYSELDTELPLLTRVLIKLGFFIANYGYIIFPFFFIIIALVFYFLFSFPKTKFIGHLFIFHLPFVGKLIKESEITRMGYILGSIYKAGIPINQALGIMPGTTTFNNYKKLYRYLSEKISEGISMSESLKSYKASKKLIPTSVLQMIYSAEKSGKLPETFFRISDLYEIKLENTSVNLPIIIEPIILIIVGLGVGVFVLATMYPIYNLVNIIK
ncbi:MAG TPA: type II secretion system F family protein [Candidatus Moranbacteria bacterium]|nr:type II secretion system F family protein [Candidatus Moranbacteria bacterium]